MDIRSVPILRNAAAAAAKAAQAERRFIVRNKKGSQTMQNICLLLPYDPLPASRLLARAAWSLRHAGSLVASRIYPS